MSADRLAMLAGKYVELRDRKRRLEQDVEDVKAEMALINQEMVPILQTMEAQSVKLEGIGTVYLQTKFYASVIKDKVDEFTAWLDSHELGHLAKRNVHPQTLKSEYQRWQDEDLPVPPPELVTAHPETKVVVRKS